MADSAHEANNSQHSHNVATTTNTSTQTQKENRTNNIPRTLQKTRNLLKQSMDKEIYVNIENSSGTVNFFAALIFLSFIVKFIFGGTSSDGYTGDASTTLWSYSIILLSLICILVLQTIIPKTSDSSGGGNIAQIFPVILTIVAFIWSLTMNLKYYKKLNKGEIAKEYYAWSKMSTIFLMIQTLLLVAMVRLKFNNILSGDYKKVGQGGQSGKVKMLFGNIFFMVIIFIVLGIQQVILDKFTVDG